MKLKQKNALIGMILGDAYLQKTGKQNSRIRLEHSVAQKEYLLWKVSLLQNYFQSSIQVIKRTNIHWHKTYSYVRIQSTSSPEVGKLQRLFYKESKKIIPDTFKRIFKDPLSLAIWFMDDGYYYPRDKMSYIYIPNYDEESLVNLLLALKENFLLMPQLKRKKKGLVLVLNVVETKKLVDIIKSYIIPSMLYKISLDPVSTDRNSKNFREVVR